MVIENDILCISDVKFADDFLGVAKFQETLESQTANCVLPTISGSSCRKRGSCLGALLCSSKS